MTFTVIYTDHPIRGFDTRFTVVPCKHGGRKLLKWVQLDCVYHDMFHESNTESEFNEFKPRLKSPKTGFN